MAIGVEVVDVVKQFGSVAVLDHVSLRLEPGQVTGLLGNSGSGKTTLLRIVAGLEQCTAGDVRLTNGDSKQPRAKPSIGMVFQNLALWPHLTARQHIECVLSALPRGERRHRAESLLAEVSLPPSSWDRRPSQLSGGEGQRLALARALAVEPDLLLLDEPLAHLDAALRGEMLTLLTSVIADRGATTLYVTHHAAEAVELCRTMIVLDGGRVAQQGSPAELFWSPQSDAVARLTGPCFEVPRSWIDDGSVGVDSQHPSWRGLLPVGNDQILLRPQQLCIGPSADVTPWRVVFCQPQESGWVAVINGQPGRSLRVPTTAHLAAGQTVALTIQVVPAY